jgi:hypothetical protein
MQDGLPLQLCSKHHTVASINSSKAFLNEHFKEHFVPELADMTHLIRCLTGNKLINKPIMIFKSLNILDGF